MAIDAGPWYSGNTDNDFRIGIDVSRSPSTITHSTTSVTYTIRYYVQSRYPVGDNEDLYYYGNGVSGSPKSFYHSQSGGEWILVTSQSYSRSLSFTSTYDVAWSARLRGVYNGAEPYHIVEHTVPKRPAAAPDDPGRPAISSVGSTSVSFFWNEPDDNGAAIDQYGYRVERNGNFVDGGFNSGSDRTATVSGLDPDTAYTCRVRARNSEGWSDFSPSRSFTTGITTPNAPGGLSASNIGPTTATLTWNYPSDDGGGSVIGYRVQVSRNSGFSDLVYNTYIESTSRTRNITGLLPGQDYYARVRATNDAGNGSYSSAETFSTLSGVKVGNGSGWDDAVMWVGNGSQWELAEIHVGDGTNWVP